MPSDSTMTKIVWQYSEPLPEETMIFLRGIAVDCCKVKNYVYEHYSGVKNLNNLTPVYTILNEMRYCGLREQLNLPAVYYELAIADAVTNIKCSWGIVKNKVGEKITANENLSDDDRIYLRTVLKIGSVYAAILNRQEYEMPRKFSIYFCRIFLAELRAIVVFSPQFPQKNCFPCRIPSIPQEKQILPVPLELISTSSMVLTWHLYARRSRMGCSQRYPENTLLAFEKAAAVRNLTGIELDIQMTKDGELVVIHDERVDRTTEGIGFVRDYTLSQLKKLHIYADSHLSQTIPTMNEVCDLLKQRLKTGLRLNIELKNSIFPYDGMEEKIVELVHKRGIQEAVVYSTFYAKSLEKLRQIDEDAELGILDSRASDCLYKAKGGCGAAALHPFWKGIDLTVEELEGYTVRAWMSGHLYPEKPTGGKLDLTALERQGITDIILNEPEAYRT